MQEVYLRIKFTAACLGGIRATETDAVNRFAKDADGQVIFMQNWWDSIMRYAAQAISWGQALVGGISWGPVIDGRIDLFNRPWRSGKEFTVHEAFLPGTIVACHAMVPDSIPRERFEQLLRAAGKYRGISPYGHDKGFGRFTVEEVNYVGSSPH